MQIEENAALEVLEGGRTDPHRPSVFMPTDYTWVMSYSAPSSGSFGQGFRFDCARDKAEVEIVGGVTILKAPGKHSEDLTCCVRAFRAAGALFTTHGGPRHCSVCGAFFTNGDVWKHTPTGEHIYIGHICADKYGMDATRDEWIAWHKEQSDLRRKATKEKARYKKAQEAKALFLKLAENAGLEEALTVDHPILKDMADKLNQLGSLTWKQVAFAKRLAEEVKQKQSQPKVEEKHVPAPEGRVTFSGEIVSAKTQASDWGEVIKIVVKVTTPEGVWLAWVTAADSILGGDRALRGRKVEMTATLTRGKDAHFAFGKRPTGAKLLEN